MIKALSPTYNKSDHLKVGINPKTMIKQKKTHDIAARKENYIKIVKDQTTASTLMHEVK